MRVAALLWPRWLPLLGGMLASCTPRADLDAYSAGAEATDDAALQPEGEGVSSPVSPAAMSSEVSSDQPPTAASDADGNVEGQAPPGGLASAADPDESTTDGAPAESMPPADSVPAESMPPAEEPAGAEPPAAVPPTASPPPEFRFVRLVADTEVVEGPLTAIAEFGVLGADGQPLARDGWVATADSAEAVYVGGAPASMAIDGDAATMWHTPWFQVVPPPHPHYLQVDLGQPRRIGGFRYLARQDGQVYGRIGDYRFFVSVDGVEWGVPVAAGSLADSVLTQDVSLASPP